MGFNNKHGGRGGNSQLKNVIDVMAYFKEQYGSPRKQYKWVNGEMVETNWNYYSVQNNIMDIINYSCKDYSFFSSISLLFSRIKRLFTDFRFKNKSVDDKYKATQQEVHDYLTKDQNMTIDEADQTCNDAIEISE